MKFNRHIEQEGKHAFLSASQFRWITWDDETLYQRFVSRYATQLGTALHSLASDCIRSRTKLNKSDRHLVELYLYKNYIPKNVYDVDSIIPTLSMYINDAIMFRMASEVVLYYTDNCFGTADAICFDEKSRILRIHDYKTGLTKTHMEQLIIYACLFYLEYGYNFLECDTYLRIYQNEEYFEYIPQKEEIEQIMKIIVTNDEKINMFKEGGKKIDE